ncbi:MAG: SHOCT domain-containing protein, partial [Acidimicrobiales bacterium]
MDIKRIEALEKLADLKRRDVLTDAEFQSAKKKILAEQVIAVEDRKEPQTNIVMKSNEEPITGASLPNEPSISEDQIKELKILESLLTSRSITQEEFAELKKKILDTELPQSSSPTSATEE